MKLSVVGRSASSAERNELLRCGEPAHLCRASLLQPFCARRHVGEGANHKVRGALVPSRLPVHVCRAAAVCGLTAQLVRHATLPPLLHKQALAAGRCRRPLPPPAAAALSGVFTCSAGCALNPWCRSGRVLADTFFKKAKVSSRQPGTCRAMHEEQKRDSPKRCLPPLEPFSLHLLPGACRPRAMWHAPPTSCKRSRRSTSSSSQALKCWTWAATPGPGCRCATPPVGKGGQCLLQRNTAWVATHEPSRKMPLRAALHAAGCLRVTGTREEGGPGDWS